MCYQNSEIIQIVKNQNNSNELFKKWNTENRSDTRCSNCDCEDYVHNNAYIVTKVSSFEKKFIVPLCQACYKKENNIKDQSKPNFIDNGSIISVDKNSLLEYIK